MSQRLDGANIHLLSHIGGSCPLCLAEKTAIARDNRRQMFKRRRELLDRCLHKDPFKLSNFCKSQRTPSVQPDGEDDQPAVSNQTFLQLYIFSQSSLPMISLSSQQLYMFSQSNLLMGSLYMTSITSLQQNMTSQPTLFLESLYINSLTSLQQNMTSQHTLFMGSLYVTSLTSLQFCITSQ